MSDEGHAYLQGLFIGMAIAAAGIGFFHSGWYSLPEQVFMGIGWIDADLGKHAVPTTEQFIDELKAAQAEEGGAEKFLWLVDAAEVFDIPLYLGELSNGQE